MDDPVPYRSIRECLCLRNVEKLAIRIKTRPTVCDKYAVTGLHQGLIDSISPWLHTEFGGGGISQMTYFVRVYMRHCHAYTSK